MLQIGKNARLVFVYEKQIVVVYRFFFASNCNNMVCGKKLYKKSSQKSQEKEPTLMDNQESQEWEIVDDLLKISIEDIDPNPNDDGFHNLTLL